MATLSKVPSLVASHSAFNCNDSLTARVVGPWYAVFSYGEHFPVAIRRREAGEAWAINADKSSPTTSRHQSTVLQGVLASGKAHVTACTQTLINLPAGGV